MMKNYLIIELFLSCCAFTVEFLYSHSSMTEKTLVDGSTSALPNLFGVIKVVGCFFYHFVAELCQGNCTSRAK